MKAYFDNKEMMKRWANIWEKGRIYLQIGLPLLILALVWFEIKHINIHVIRQALAQADWASAGIGVFFAFLAFLVMGLYDAVAFPCGKTGRLTFGKRWTIGSILFAWTNFVSMGPLGGPALRILVYRRFGLQGAEISKGLITHYVGMAGGIVGWLLAMWIYLPASIESTPLRLVLAFVACILVTNLLGRGAALILNRFPGKKLGPLPSLSIMGTVSFCDWGLTLLSFCFLVRSVGVDAGFVAAARTVFVGQLAGLLSSIPGGLGSADAVWLKGFSLLGVGSGAAGAAVVMFRGGFYLVPWFVALLALYILAARHSQQLRLWQRRIVAGAVLVNGFLLLVSTAIPSLQQKLKILEELVPLWAVEMSHTMATLAAALMLFLVRGLWKGYRAAYLFSMALFAASVLAHVLKGGDFEEAIISVVLMLLLFGARKAFNRKGRIPLEWEMALAVGVAVLVTYLVVGFTAFEHINLGGEAWLTFAYGAQSNRFLRTALLLCVVAGVVVAREAFSPVSEWMTPSREEIARAEAFCRLHADSADALQVGGGDKAIWFWEPNGELSGLVIFQCFAGRLIVYKDPVLLHGADASRLLDDFFKYAETLDGDVLFAMITGEWMTRLHDFGYHFLKVTEEAIVPLQNFSLQGAKNAGLRRILRGIDRAGVTFSYLEPPFADALIDELREVSDVWLLSKGGREMQFTPCYFSPDYIQRNPVAVARNAEGKIIAFLNVLATREEGGAALDFIRYIPESIDNVMDFVILHTLEMLAARGYHSFSLGGAPMSAVGIRTKARLVERAMHFFSLRAERLYNFSGLLRYKSKFHPEWIPRYLAYPKPWDWASALSATLRLVQAGSREAKERIAAARLGY